MISSSADYIILLFNICKSIDWFTELDALIGLLKIIDGDLLFGKDKFLVCLDWTAGLLAVDFWEIFL